jgi:NADPH-dependent 2,4-dienoyl-CoA reductase/sulfur reductase-like enzyme
MTHDLIVIGAGPAGMAAAVAGAEFGLKTAVLEEQIRPGGQIYRNILEVAPDLEAMLGVDYTAGRQLAQTFAASAIDRFYDASVWNIAPDLTVAALQDGRTVQLRAPQLIVATGAIERPSPVPGWTLPGALNAGAAQIALKSGGSVPAGRVLLAGSGPLLLLVACQLLAAGATLLAILETTPPRNAFRALPYLPQALMAPKLLAKGLGMMRRIRRARIPWFRSVYDLSIEGRERVEAVSFKVGRRRHHLEADIVLLHHGVVSNTQISRLLRVEHDWNDAQQAWHPRRDEFCQTSLSGLRIAGDGGGIAGAVAAGQSGRLAAIGAAHALGRLSDADRDRLAYPLRKTLDAQLRIRPFLDALYRPPEWITAPADSTIVCRCEEITAAEVVQTVRLGSLGPNQTKFFSRCGMGPCQGRICGMPVVGILARELGKSPAEVGAYRVRAPLKPIPLASMARLEQPEATVADRPAHECRPNVWIASDTKTGCPE